MPVISERWAGTPGIDSGIAFLKRRESLASSSMLGVSTARELP
jgi:hypothetical protein